jgi:hypothetical protein
VSTTPATPCGIRAKCAAHKPSRKHVAIILHAQADSAVIGAFLLDAAHGAILLVAPVLATVVTMVLVLCRDDDGGDES